MTSRTEYFINLSFEINKQKIPQKVYFKNLPCLVNIDISAFESITNADYMFENCTNLKSIDCNMPNCTTAEGMFKNCSSLENIRAKMPLVNNVKNFAVGTSVSTLDIHYSTMINDYSTLIDTLDDIQTTIVVSDEVLNSVWNPSTSPKLPFIESMDKLVFIGSNSFLFNLFTNNFSSSKNVYTGKNDWHEGSYNFFLAPYFYESENFSNDNDGYGFAISTRLKFFENTDDEFKKSNTKIYNNNKYKSSTSTWKNPTIDSQNIICKLVNYNSVTQKSINSLECNINFSKCKEYGITKIEYNGNMNYLPDFTECTITNLDSAFKNCSNIKLPKINWNEVESMDYCFDKNDFSAQFVTDEISIPPTPKLKSAICCFRNASVHKVIFEDVPKLEDASKMFERSSLREVSLTGALSLKKIDYIYRNTELTEIDASIFNNVESAEFAFSGINNVVINNWSFDKNIPINDILTNSTAIINFPSREIPKKEINQKVIEITPIDDEYNISIYNTKLENNRLKEEFNIKVLKSKVTFMNKSQELLIDNDLTESHIINAIVKGLRFGDSEGEQKDLFVIKGKTPASIRTNLINISDEELDEIIK